METALYWIGHGIIGIASILPLKLVAWLGRRAGRLAWHLDRRHRNVALENLVAAFPEHSETETRELAREHFRRLGETYSCILKTGGMNAEDIGQILSFEGCDKLDKMFRENPDERVVIAIGHFGNFELFPWFRLGIPSSQNWAGTYRELRQPKMTELMLRLRTASGCQLFERTREGDRLREAMRQPALVLGLLADQHAGASGLRLPVFGRNASVTPAPAVMAKRYRCRLFHGACFRTGLGRWKIEVTDEIPIRKNGKHRDTKAITRDIITAQEAAIRRDPANWFWVHNRWKNPPKPRESKP